MTGYWASPRAWADVHGMSGPGRPENQCLLELRARIEALEAEGCPHIATSTEGTSYCRLAEQMATSQPTSNPSQIRSSLVERVSCAIDGRINPDQWLHQDAARAAIREVAIWLMERGYRTQSLLLNDEAER